MAYVAVDRDGTEKIFNKQPKRTYYNGLGGWAQRPNSHRIILPQGTIEKLLGYRLEWKDEAVEID